MTIWLLLLLDFIYHIHPLSSMARHTPNCSWMNPLTLCLPNMMFMWGAVSLRNTITTHLVGLKSTCHFPLYSYATLKCSCKSDFDRASCTHYQQILFAPPLTAFWEIWETWALNKVPLDVSLGRLQSSQKTWLIHKHYIQTHDRVLSTVSSIFLLVYKLK